MRTPFLLLIFAAGLAGQNRYLPGYADHSRGLTMEYHSTQDDATKALLCRSQNGKRTMAWRTAPIPADHAGDFAEFVWIAGIDVTTPPRRFEVFLNGRKYFTLVSPMKSVIRTTTLAANDVSLTFRRTLIDRHSDLFGYMFLRVPTRTFPRGKPIEIEVVAESAGTTNWFMVMRYAVGNRVDCRPEPAVLRTPDGPRQTLRLRVLHYDEPIDAIVHTPGAERKVTLEFGANTFRVGIPAVEEETSVEVRVTSKHRVVGRATAVIEPVKPLTVYLLHHSHIDIGYTHTQEEVERKHWRYLEHAIELAQRTEGHPEGARFRWNTEGAWAVETYLRRASDEQKRALQDAIRRGWIEVGALFADQLTGLASPPELAEMTRAARRIASACGVRLTSAMTTDVPGCTWSLVPTLAHAGVKYLSLGPNHFHRIGDIIDVQGDRPFYWASASGEEKVLCWLHQKGYALFHTGLNYSKIRVKLSPKKVFNYLSELAARNYPYDMTILRYAIGSDNGPCDPDLPDAVRAWNENYVTPRMVISTTTEAMRAFEAKYGAEIPTVRGDLTPYWEDGAASTARETALNRRAAERLAAAEAMWCLRNPEPFPRGRFDEAWRHVLLFHEHTWGSWNSVSEPEGAFTNQLWKTKESYAREADRRSKRLATEAGSQGAEATPDRLDVWNTLSWDRTDVVVVDHARSRVRGPDGKPLPSQRLADGALAVRIERVPALSGTRLRLEAGEPHTIGDAFADGHRIGNGRIRIEIDPETGTIRSLRHRGRECVDTSDLHGLNEYRYVEGRDPKNSRTTGRARVRVVDKGPLVATIVVESDAPGCNRLTRRITVTADSDVVRIENTLDKRRTYDPEGVHVAFPFAVPHGVVRVGLAGGAYRVGSEQLPGSCRNYLTAHGWVDVSGEAGGVTLAVPDTPLFEIGGITTDPLTCGWLERIEPSSTLYSYVMNNYWETNYRAAQEGLHTFRYALRPHGGFDPARAHRFGAERSRPLAVVPAVGAPPPASLVRFRSDRFVVTRLTPTRSGTLMTVLNADDKPATLAPQWCDRVTAAWRSSLSGTRDGPLAEPVVPGWGIRYVLVELAPPR